MIRIIADTRKATQHWEHRCDQLPYLIIPMSNGDIVRYNPEIVQPKPYFKEALDEFTDLCVGYERE